MSIARNPLTRLRGSKLLAPTLLPKFEYYMTRTESFAAEVKEISRQFIRAKMPNPKILIVEMCLDLHNEGHTWAWDSTKVASGTQNEFIKKAGFVACNKTDASAVMIIGEKNDADLWIGGKFKKYWIKRTA